MTATTHRTSRPRTRRRAKAASSRGRRPTTSCGSRWGPTWAYLGRYKGQARVHTGSDLKVFTTWSTERGLDPLDPHQVGRPQVEAFVG